MAEPQRKRATRDSTSASQQVSSAPETQRPVADPCPIVGIGASAGGLEALQQFFTAVPADCGVAFVVIQHLDPTHRRLMDDLLQKYTTMPVVQAEDGMRIAPDHVYLIPPNTSLTLSQGVLWVEPPVAPRGYRVPIDRFFQSLAHDQGDKAICVILSGTGSDGTSGLKVIKEHGGLAMVQQDARYTGMPYSAIETGLVDAILPAADIPARGGLYPSGGISDGKW